MSCKSHQIDRKKFVDHAPIGGRSRAPATSQAGLLSRGASLSSLVAWRRLRAAGRSADLDAPIANNL
jgi:hypothetical protein